MIGITLKKEDKKFIDKVFSTSYKVMNKNLKKTLIIDATYTEPYYHVNEFLIKKYTKQILKCINALIESNIIKKCFIMITNEDEIMKQKIEKYANKNIEVIKTPNKYPIRLEKNLIHYSKTEQKPNNITVVELKDFFKPINTKIVTVYYDKIYDIEVENNSKIKDILRILKIKGKLSIYINGPLRGKKVSEYDFITDDTFSIYLEKKDIINEKTCIKCGKCIEKCPLKLNPTNINEKFKEKCIKCGICTYICPAFIPLNKKIEGDLDE